MRHVSSTASWLAALLDGSDDVRSCHWSQTIAGTERQSDALRVVAQPRQGIAGLASPAHQFDLWFTISLIP